MSADARWALSEGSDFFQGKGSVQETLRRIAARLDDIGVPYAVTDGMALFHHGYRRFSEDIDILVSAESLQQIHDRLEGLGYLPPFAGSKNLRDAESGVKIEFLVTGGYPGDGKPKPVAFPAPQAVAEESDGIRYVRIATLVELKLASGMSSPSRLRDLADVLALIQQLHLDQTFASQLDASVRPKFLELLQHASEGDAC